MSTSQPAMLSFRPKSASALSQPKQHIVTESSYTAAAARNRQDTQFARAYLVERESIFQDVARLATRTGQPHVFKEDMTIEEARRRIALEEANAIARIDLFTGGEIERKILTARGRGRGMGRVSQQSQIRDNSPSEEDGLDDLNRLISTTEDAVHGIASKSDVEFVGMEELLEGENEWHSSSETKRATLEKAMITARDQGDYLARFHPQTYEQLATFQQTLFQTAGDGDGGMGARKDSHQDVEFSANRCEGGNQGWATLAQAENDEEMGEAPECGSTGQPNDDNGGGDSMDID